MTSRRTSVFAGALLTVGMRWTDRLIGLISTMILARLLAPDDFGIVAAASIVVSLVDVLLDLGVNIALIHKKDADREDFDTAWTIRLTQAGLGAVIIALAGPLAADYFRDPPIAGVMQVMAFTVLAGGLENIGTVAFQKNMEFGRDFRFLFVRRIGTFLVTIGLAWLLRSYWALVLGALAGRLFGVALSYGMSEYRPRLCWSRLRAMWSISQWALLANVGGFADTRVDKLTVGRLEASSTLGAYSLADEIAALPSTELLAPVGRVLFPAYVEARSDPQRLKRAYLLALAVQAIIALPAGVGLALVATEAVAVLLGAKWLVAVPLIEILAIANLSTALTSSAGYLMMALGRLRINALVAWLRVLTFVVLAWWLVAPGEVEMVARLRLSVAAVSLTLFSMLVLRVLPTLSAVELLRAVWRPLFGALAMVAVLSVVPFPPAWPPLVLLPLKIGVGALVYVVAVMALWRASACPEGAESYMLGKLRLDGLFRRLLRAAR